MTTTSTKYQQAVDIIREMTPGERLELQSHLKSLTKLNGSNTEAVDLPKASHTSIVVNQLLRFLVSVGAYSHKVNSATTSIVEGTLGAAGRLKCEEVWKFVESQVGSRIEREALLHVGFRSLYADLKSWMQSVGIQEMLRNIDRLPGALDSEFPGYAESGMLRFVVRASSRVKS